MVEHTDTPKINHSLSIQYNNHIIYFSIIKWLHYLTTSVSTKPIGYSKYSDLIVNYDSLEIILSLRKMCFSGALFSIMSALESVGSLMASVSLPKILPITLEHNMNPGTSYMVMAAVGLLALPFLGWEIQLYQACYQVDSC